MNFVSFKKGKLLYLYFFQKIDKMLEITRPTLLLKKAIAKENLQRMLATAKHNDVELIPHFKTHQSAAVGEWFREAGVKSITVTSVKMANYFASHGWKDISIAFPVNPLEIEGINSLTTRVDLKIFLNSTEAAKLLIEGLKHETSFYVEVNVGDDRSGLEFNSLSAISEILEATKNSVLKFLGFYTHAGQTYGASSRKDLEAIHDSTLEKLSSLKSHFKEEYPGLKISLGDTPSCSLLNNFKGIDSIHPGNFIYYDLVQHQIGSNSIEEIAICLAVPVVSIHPEREEVIVHSGWVHQGKDSLTDLGGQTHYGLVVRLKDNGWSAPIPKARVVKLSQEHGVLKMSSDMIKEIKIGDILGILPVHACATAVMMGEAYTLEGEQIEMMPQ